MLPWQFRPNSCKNMSEILFARASDLREMFSERLIYENLKAYSTISNGVEALKIS